MLRRIEIFEHDVLRVGGVDGMTESQFDALVRFNDAQKVRFFDVGHRKITMKNFVGYLEVGNLALEVLPKADRSASHAKGVWRSGLIEMIRVALNLRLETPAPASQQSGRSQLLDLIAAGFLTELEGLLRQGLAKGYRTTESNGNVFRGRLKVAANLRENIGRADRFYVEHQTYDHQILVNVLLGAALQELSMCALSATTVARLQRCRASFPELPDSDIAPDAFERVRFNRATTRYEAALVFARMILEHQGPQLRSGKTRVFALLFDMNVLWERFVAALFRRAGGDGVATMTQERHLFWKPTGLLGRHVRPDIVLRAKSGPERGEALLIADTKWKVPSHGVPSDDDLKQMFVYNELLAGARSVLIYPRCVDVPSHHAPFQRRNHSCEQLHLEVAPRGRWSTADMQEQVAALIRSAVQTSSAIDERHSRS